MGVWLLLVIACSGPAPAGRADVDGDGWSAPEDCDDRNPRVRPDADETWYDGVDQDCDGADDFDQDGDGDRLRAGGGTDCDDEDATVSGLDVDADGVSTCDGDCDDADARAVPGGAPVCGDGVDSDCDGVPDCQMSGERDVLATAVAVIDSGDRSFGAVLATADLDGDGVDDLLAGGIYVPAVSWWRGPLVGELAVADGVDLGAPSGALVVHDLTGDGSVDLYLEGAATDSVLYAGPLTPDAPGTWFGQGGGWSAAGGDVTGDGVPDLVRAGGVLLSVQAGPDWTDPATWTSLEPGHGWRLDGEVGVVDGDGDGVDDVLTTMDGAVWLLAGPVAFGRSTVVDAGEQVIAVDRVDDLVLLDADGDGREDVVGHEENRPAMVYTAPFDGLTAAAAALPESDMGNHTYTRAAVGDLDADGWDDVAIGYGGYPADETVVAVYHGPLVDADPRITRFRAAGHDLRGITAGDLTGDGVDDLVLSLDDEGRSRAQSLFIVPGEPHGW